MRPPKDQAYVTAYNRGWKAGQRETFGALERADFRNEHEAWYDGYLDAAAGREKWHLASCSSHEACG